MTQRIPLTRLQMFSGSLSRTRQLNLVVWFPGFAFHRKMIVGTKFLNRTQTVLQPAIIQLAGCPVKIIVGNRMDD